jgi:Tol biopolymer transport system component
MLGWSVYDARSDFNGDGKTDLVWKNTSGAVQVWTMDGTTNTANAVFGPYAGWDVVDTHRDFNGDGKNDLLWKETTGRISVWLMDGITNTANASFGPYAGWDVLTTTDVLGAGSDFNGDGKSDIAWQNANGALAVWTMDGTTNTGNAAFGPYSGWTPDLV